MPAYEGEKVLQNPSGFAGAGDADFRNVRNSRSLPKETELSTTKEEVTVARLKEAYGKPEYHIQFDEETSETLFGEDHKKIGTIYYDEEIAFTIEDYFVIYYFSKGKFLARVIRGEPKASGVSDPSGPKAKEAK